MSFEDPDVGLCLAANANHSLLLTYRELCSQIEGEQSEHWMKYYNPQWGDGIFKRVVHSHQGVASID